MFTLPSFGEMGGRDYVLIDSHERSTQYAYSPCVLCYTARLIVIIIIIIIIACTIVQKPRPSTIN